MTIDTRSGCQVRVCWCHIDPQQAGFTCSSCGCQVLRTEETTNPTRDAYDNGYNDGHAAGVLETTEDGYSKGYDEGYDSGWHERDRAYGITQTTAETIFSIIERLKNPLPGFDDPDQIIASLEAVLRTGEAL